MASTAILLSDSATSCPYGWVDRTREMQDDSAERLERRRRSLLLLAIFERPPEATGDTVNSAVVIAAEPLSSYSGMKTAADYFGPLTELATAKGFQAVEEPHACSRSAPPNWYVVISAKRGEQAPCVKPRW